MDKVQIISGLNLLRELCQSRRHIASLP
jgi:hypothetical protein